MITVLGALVGLLPNLFKYFQDASDKKQELAIMQMQLQMMQTGLKERLQEVEVNAQVAQSTAIYNTIKTNIPWVDALNGVIRPLIALIYTTKVVCAIYSPETIQLVEHDYGIYACIIAFYFGGLVRCK